MKKARSSYPRPPARPADLAEPEPDHTALDWAREIGEAEHVIEDLDHYVRRRRKQRRVAVVGGVGLLMFIAAFLWLPSRSTPAHSLDTATTNAAVLRPKIRTLPDGSVAELDAGADIETRFGASFRQVILRKGQAHFQVAKDALRPFTVSANGVCVRAVGTAFSVQVGARAVEVLVTEGRVAVENTAPTANPADPTSATLTPGATVAAGNRIVVTLDANGSALGSPSVEPIASADLEAALSWRMPWLEFAATPLAQALSMFNQHSRVRIVFSDPSIGKLQLSGVLRADNTESLLRLLEGDFGLVTVRTGDEITLRRP